MSLEAENGPKSTPVNFWGEMPEEEYYTSQGVRNTKSYFETPNGKLFTQSFLPLDGEIKGTVYMSHGYGSDTSWLFQKILLTSLLGVTPSLLLISLVMAVLMASAAIWVRYFVNPKF